MHASEVKWKTQRRETSSSFLLSLMFWLLVGFLLAPMSCSKHAALLFCNNKYFCDSDIKIWRKKAGLDSLWWRQKWSEEMRWSMWNKTSKRNWNSLSGRISEKYTAKQKGEKTNNGAGRGRDSQQFSFLWKSDLAEIDLGKKILLSNHMGFLQNKIVRYEGQWHSCY